MTRVFVIIGLSLALTSSLASAQGNTRIRGTVAGLDGNVLSVTDRGGKTVAIQLAEKTEIVFTQPIALAEIKPGDFLAVTSKRGADGRLTAYEVRRFPKPLNPGHRPFDGREDQTMTNATVSTMVAATNGRELTLTYEGGSQKIVVPADASISTLVPGERSHAPIFDPATLHGVGPRVEEPAVGLDPLLFFAAPYEEMRLKKP